MEEGSSFNSSYTYFPNSEAITWGEKGPGFSQSYNELYHSNHVLERNTSPKNWWNKGDSNKGAKSEGSGERCRYPKRTELCPMDRDGHVGRRLSYSATSLNVIRLFWAYKSYWQSVVGRWAEGCWRCRLGLAVWVMRGARVRAGVQEEWLYLRMRVYTACMIY